MQYSNAPETRRRRAILTIVAGASFHSFPPQSTANMSLKLTYFADGKGRNELVRLIFAVGGVSYEDDLIGVKQYKALRDDGVLPWGQLPVLTITKGKHEKDEEEEVFGQSCSIARYAAKVANLYPKDPIDALRSDVVVDSWRDTLDLYYDCYFERKILGGRMQMFPRKPAERCARLKVLLDTELKEQFCRFERLLAKNAGGAVCVEKDSNFPCWADLAIYDLVKTMEGVLIKDVYDALMDEKPNMKSLVEVIDDMEGIQEHLKKCPYIDLTHLFAYVPWWKRIVHAVVFPFLKIVFGIQSRLAPRIDTHKGDKGD